MSDEIHCVHCLKEYRTGADKLCDDCRNVTLEACKASIFHVLAQIRDRADVGFYLGTATESFSLLIHAAALLTGNPEEILEGKYHNPNAADPREEIASKVRESCCDEITESMTWQDVLDYLEGCAVPERIELMRELKARFCPRCGGDNHAWAGECGCVRSLHFTRKGDPALNHRSV